MSDLLLSWIKNAIYWRPEFADDNEHPQKVDQTPGRGTYQSDPYLLFVKADDGSIHLISDGTLDIAVTPDDSVTDSSRTSFKIAPSHPGDTDSWVDARIDIFIDNPSQFRVVGTANNCELQPGRYNKIKFRNDEKADKTQLLDDYFAHTETQFYNVQNGYDVTKLILENPGATHNFNLFALPDGATRKYDSPGGLVIPWGWRFAGDSQAFGETKKTVISNGSELANSTKNTFGSKSSMDLLGLNIGQSISHSNQSQLQLMQDRELTVITATNTLTSHAIVLDKTNVRLADVFYEALADLLDDIDQKLPLDTSLKTFIQNVGTHYPNAVTFGSKVFLISTATQEQIVQISNQGIDVKEGLEIGVSESAEVDGINLTLGQSQGKTTDQSTENSKKLQSLLGFNRDSLKVIGGHSGGEASASSLVPVMLDLRPISDLLAPPFFNDWKIIGLHPESLRSRLAAFIESYAFYKIDPQGQRKTRLQRFAYTSNRVAQCKDSPAEGYPPADNLPMGGAGSVQDTELFNFTVSSGSQNINKFFCLHDSMLISADQLTMAVDVPISRYPTVLGIPNPQHALLTYSLNQYTMEYNIDEEVAYFQKTGGMAKPYSFTIATDVPEVEIMLPYLIYGESHLGGWATFAFTPVSTIQALGLD